MRVLVDRVRTSTCYWTHRVGDVLIIGLNTAMLSQEKNEKGRLSLGNVQLDALAAADKSTLLVVLAHHPPSWLYDGKRFESILLKRPHILLSGHDHHPAIPSRGDEPYLVHFQAGATYVPELSNVECSYSWLRIRGEDLILWPRAWSSVLQSFVPATQHIPGLTPEGSKTIARFTKPWDALCREPSSTTRTIAKVGAEPRVRPTST